jgi:exodeoxyribonuclease V beta subunit
VSAAVPFEVAGPLPVESLALEASAGTGKTWTLTSLAVRYVAEGVADLPELLLVTFTRAATAELRERVRTRLAEALAAAEAALAGADWHTDDEVLDRIVGDALRAGDGGRQLRERRDRLRRGAQQLDEATISTIHGFCQRMLQHAALEAGVDFDAVLLDDDTELLTEIVDDHLARELRRADAAWVTYLRECGKVTHEQLARLAREVAGLPALRLRPDLDSSHGEDLRSWEQAVEELRVVWEGGGRESAIALIGGLKDDGAFDNPRQTTFSAKAAETAAGKVDAWLVAQHPLPPGKIDRKTPHNIKHYPMSYFTRDALASKLPEGATPPEHEVFTAAERVLAAATEPATRFLLRAATYVWEELERRKRQRTVLTFDDLLRRLAGALDDASTRDAVRAAIRQRYRVALIDEFQDTDSVQWRIFDALFGGDEPFILIGDPKQAIYAFRGADVHTYVHARDSRPDQRTLQTNRRSDEQYVRACNVLFGQPAAFGTGDIPYHDIAAHHGDRLADSAGGAALRLRYVHRDAGETTPQRGAEVLTKGWAAQALPPDVAAVAVSLLEGEVTVDAGADDSGRPLVPRDLAVLVRTNRRAHAVQRALRDAGVPAVIQRGGSVFATEEAEALQRLLAALLRPSAERPAVAAAASILFGRDAPTLVAQRDALDRETDGDTDDGEGEIPDSHAWDHWIDLLTRWSERWHRSGVLPAVRQAFAEDRVPERLLATPEGERRLTNVRHLIELLHTAETTEGLTPNTLVDWLQAHRADAADGELPGAETELRLEEDAEAVRVVTVHGSKGLQYPVVLCPDLWDGPDRVDEALTRFHDPDVGDPSDAITLDVSIDTAQKARSLELARSEDRTEQLRLAYVALTRAQHRCIVWWGPFYDAATSPLASLLHGGDEDDPAVRLARGEQRLADDDADLLADLRALADGSAGAIDVEEVRSLEAGASWHPEVGAPPELTPRAFARGDIDRTWWRTSFTRLVRDAEEHAIAAVDDTGRDVDAEVEDEAERLVAGGGVQHLDDEAVTATDDEPVEGPAEGTDGDDVPLAGFPRGAGPGTFLHDVLERAEFRGLADDETFDELLQAMERRHGIDPAHRPAARTGLLAAVATPLGSVADDTRLADLGVEDRLNELRFELPLAGGHDPRGEAFTLSAVAQLLADADDPLLAAYAPRLRDPALRGRVRGFLNGSIDLLARLPDGRILVADYKSNWHGDRATGRSRASDYHPELLQAAMLDHHYVLQGLLYLVAAHRYLRWRLPDYDYDTHVAGAGYLFLRGMVGAETPRVEGEPCGVVALRPDGALIAALSRLLDGGSP